MWLCQFKKIEILQFSGQIVSKADVSIGVAWRNLQLELILFSWYSHRFLECFNNAVFVKIVAI